MSNPLQTTQDAKTTDIIDRSVKDIPIESIIEYADREPPLSYQEIADLVGCSKQNVYDRLHRVGYNRTNAKHFEKNRAKTFQFLQSRLLNSIDDKDIKGTPIYQRIIGASILYDKERLESGKSTANISVADVQGTIADLQKQADD